MKKIAIITIIAIFALTLGGLISFYNKIPEQNIAEKTLRNADAIVVLTGGQQRIPEGINLMQQKKSDWMLISGVHEKTKIDEITNHLNSENITKNITLGRFAQTTKGNAIETKEWVAKNNVNSIILVTANYHMPRTISIFKREMPTLNIQPYPVFPPDFQKETWYKNWNSAKLITAEYVKFLLTF